MQRNGNMKFGLIGNKLKKSYSKIIHDDLSNNTYELWNLKNNEFVNFITQKNFDGINVTIPFKEKVIPFLDFIDEEAKVIGCVNTIKKENNKLYGYNTDAFGFTSLLDYFNIDVKGKNILILGTGATSKTVNYVLSKRNVNKITFVSRSHKASSVTYTEAISLTDTNIIINTTPYGMNPNLEKNSLLSLNSFSNLETVIDVIYNPLRTPLLIEAKEKGCKAYSGLYMLVAQAIKSHEIFTNHIFNKDIIAKLYKSLLLRECNIVFIGMPSCGKSTASKAISKILCKERIDIDEEIEQQYDLSICEIFNSKGEEYFRKLETSIIKNIFNLNGKIISLGGGSLLTKENVPFILRNSLLIFLDRDLSLLKANQNAIKSRPLLKDNNSFDTLFKERYPLYLKYADIVIKNNGSHHDTKKLILEKLL